MSVFLSRPQDIPHQDVLLLLLEKGVSRTFVIRRTNFSAACPSDPSSSTSEFIGNDLLKQSYNSRPVYRIEIASYKSSIKD